LSVISDNLLNIEYAGIKPIDMKVLFRFNQYFLLRGEVEIIEDFGHAKIPWF